MTVASPDAGNIRIARRTTDRKGNPRIFVPLAEDNA
jgi:hypothetical protein